MPKSPYVKHKNPNFKIFNTLYAIYFNSLVINLFVL